MAIRLMRPSGPPLDWIGCCRCGAASCWRRRADSTRCAASPPGADTIYAGLGGFNARVSAHGFTDDEFARGCAVAHAHGVRVYVTLNVFVFDDELSDYSGVESCTGIGRRCSDCLRCRVGLRAAGD
ncbi:MAG: hypothetical protein ACLTHL_05660 [Collinsella sp.]